MKFITIVNGSPKETTSIGGTDVSISLPSPGDGAINFTTRNAPNSREPLHNSPGNPLKRLSRPSIC